MRDRRIDSLRGVAIVAVVVGHVLLAVYHDMSSAPLPLAVLFTVVTSFHVQLFAFLSGYLAKAPRTVADAARWIGSRTTRLMVPYAAWTLFFWLGTGGPGRGLGDLFHSALFPGDRTQPMWFLAALFLASLFFALLAWNEPLLVAAAVLVAVWPANSPFLAFTAAERLFPFMVAGYLARRYDWHTGWWAPVLYALTFAVLWTNAGTNLLYPNPDWAIPVNESIGEFWMLGGTMLVRLLRVIMPLMAIATLFLVARRWQPLVTFGTRSLGVYAAHQAFLGTAFGPGAIAVVTGLAGALAGAWLTTELLSRWRPTALVFLGQTPRRCAPEAPERAVP